MAIQTQGFQVRNMPQFTAPSPSLVAFNPTAVSDGMGEAFQLARQYEALKASKALQAELEATRQKRIAAQNMGLDVNIAAGGKALRQMPKVEEVENLGFDAKAKTIMPKANFELLGIEQRSKALPALTDAEIDTAKTGMEKNALMRQAMPTLVAADVAKAKAETAEAGNSVALAELRRKGQEVQLRLGAQLAELTAAGAPMEALLKATKTAQALSNAQTDEQFRKALQDAQLQLTQSQVQENLAQADYARGLGRQAAGRAETPIERAKKLQALIKELDTMKVGDGVRNLGSYMADTFNEDGSVKGDKLFGLQGNATRDPVGDFYLQQRQMYQQELLGLQSQIMGGSNGMQSRQAPTQQRTSGVPEAHKNYLRANANNPKVRADFDAKYGTGAADQILQ